MEKNLYEVVLNGNQVVFQSVNRLRAFSRARSLARKSNDYVEVWYYDNVGTRRLIDFYN